MKALGPIYTVSEEACHQEIALWTVLRTWVSALKIKAIRGF